MITANHYEALLGTPISHVAGGIPVRADGNELSAGQRGAVKHLRDEGLSDPPTLRDITTIQTARNRIVANRDDTDTMLSQAVGIIDAALQAAVAANDLSAMAPILDQLQGLRGVLAQVQATNARAEELRSQPLPATAIELIQAFDN